MGVGWVSPEPHFLEYVYTYIHTCAKHPPQKKSKWATHCHSFVTIKGPAMAHPLTSCPCLKHFRICQHGHNKAEITDTKVSMIIRIEKIKIK